ncbi:uncharacterized protein B0I36DRAFT_351292 [Microdochium trichocladiopsis]|uniref:Uncharacterized protein n=1 Tax=Microdochium trichocladiopsis TaxID=1682393 RepID=A0A9P8Y260_9PEZI|nr:uncharacterized protein B0I36DRAFT_351292 [Microdochium trichocladiopsis]KAH7027810.1 hypothetical protein B0I36DRAFT_351292 [Microdochium trichocladiopsis]
MSSSFAHLEPALQPVLWPLVNSPRRALESSDYYSQHLRNRAQVSMAPLQYPHALHDLIVERLVEPTTTTIQAATKVVLARQATTTVVTTGTVVTNDSTTLSGGAIAGIVIGSIVGFLLLLWIIRSCLNWERPETWGTTYEPSHEKTTRTRRYSYPYHHETHRSRSRHSHRSPRRSTEIRDVYYARQTGPEQVPSRGRSPRAPPAVYQVRPEANAREVRRVSRSSRYYT